MAGQQSLNLQFYRIVWEHVTVLHFLGGRSQTWSCPGVSITFSQLQHGIRIGLLKFCIIFQIYSRVNTDESVAIDCIKSYVFFCQADLGALLSWLQKKSLLANSSSSQASSQVPLTLKRFLLLRLRCLNCLNRG